MLGAWDLDQIRATGLLLDADLGRPLGRLSVGQCRQVTLARLLLESPPSVLLLRRTDQPPFGRGIDELCDALLGTPAAVVLVTHDRTLCRMVHDWPTVTLLPVAQAEQKLGEVATSQAPALSPRPHCLLDAAGRRIQEPKADKVAVRNACGERKAGASRVTASALLLASSEASRACGPSVAATAEA